MRVPRPGIAAVLGLSLVACERTEPGDTLGPDTEQPATALHRQDKGGLLYNSGDLKHPPRNPCFKPGYGQFDFWRGKWNVQGPAGLINSTSVITRELDGCVIMEDFIFNGGFQGRSLNIYDSRDDRWYQSFVDNTTGNYRLVGGLEGAEMVMNADQPAFTPGAGVRQRKSRVVWTALEDGSVRQTFDESFDGGPVTRTFDGLYLAADELDRATPGVNPFCQSSLPGARHLDFWLGEWKVSERRGPRLGRSEVTSNLNDCLIEENFSSRTGFKSRSYLFYDFTVDRWFRTYADNAGEHFELSGGLEDGQMVLTGDEVDWKGRTIRIRVVIEPAGERVEQSIEVSQDGGATWREDLALSYWRKRDD
jgi:hypothetical protein